MGGNPHRIQELPVVGHEQALRDIKWDRVPRYRGTRFHCLPEPANPHAPLAQQAKLRAQWAKPPRPDEDWTSNYCSTSCAYIGLIPQTRLCHWDMYTKGVVRDGQTYWKESIAIRKIHSLFKVSNAIRTGSFHPIIAVTEYASRPMPACLSLSVRNVIQAEMSSLHV